MFFVSIALSTLFNLIYAALRDPLTVRILHIIAYSFFCWAMVFLLLFNLILLKSEKKIHRNTQYLLIGIWSLILMGLLIIGVAGGVTIDESTGWKPSWDLSFFIYIIIVGMIFMVIPTIFFSLRIYRRFKDNELKRRWRLFLIGIFFYYFIWFGISVVNYLSNDFFRSIWAIILLLCFSSIYILYYGVAKQLTEKKSPN
jgi:hypothetical protein